MIQVHGAHLIRREVQLRCATTERNILIGLRTVVPKFILSCLNFCPPGTLRFAVFLGIAFDLDSEVLAIFELVAQSLQANSQAVLIHGFGCTLQIEQLFRAQGPILPLPILAHVENHAVCVQLAR